MTARPGKVDFEYQYSAGERWQSVILSLLLTHRPLLKTRPHAPALTPGCHRALAVSAGRHGSVASRPTPEHHLRPIDRAPQ
jgi:hypothetical protein